MKKVILGLFSAFMLLGSSAFCQDKGIYTNTIVVDGDTIPYATLREAKVVHRKMKDASYQKQYDWLKRYLIKVYPYAKVASDILTEYDTELDKLDRKRHQKRFRKYVERDLKEEFGDDLKDFTVIQGKLLIKLINRETGRTGYEIVKDMKGGLAAFSWQGMARLYGTNLKLDYRPEQEDIIVEMIVKRIENGEIYCPPRKRKTKISIDLLSSK
jgi:hypothetical protein